MPKSYTVPRGVTPTAIALFCDDPRIQDPVREFLAGELGLAQGSCIPVVHPGGVAALSEPAKFPHEFAHLRDILGFYVRHFCSIHRIVLINHQDCGKYKHLHTVLGSEFLNGFNQMEERHTQDVRVVGHALPKDLEAHHLDVEQYYARFTDQGKTRIIFEKL